MSDLRASAQRRRALSMWRVGASSVVGSSHLRRTEACQDAFAVRQAPNGTLVAVVADGAGSAAHAAEGAEFVAQRIADRVVELTRLPRRDAHLPRFKRFMREQLAAVRDDLRRLAIARSLLPRDFACTVLVVLSRGQLTVAAQIGDGAIIELSKEGVFTTLTGPRNGEYLNETTFLTSDDALDDLQIAVIKHEVGGFIMFSDGVQPIALNMATLAPHAGFFRPFVELVASASEDEAASAIQAFLASDRVRQRTDDDCTLLIAVREETVT